MRWTTCPRNVPWWNFQSNGEISQEELQSECRICKRCKGKRKALIRVKPTKTWNGTKRPMKLLVWAQSSELTRRDGETERERCDRRQLSKHNSQARIRWSRKTQSQFSSSQYLSLSLCVCVSSVYSSAKWARGVLYTVVAAEAAAVSWWMPMPSPQLFI